MAFENLSERLQKALKNLTGKGKISEADINDASREIRLHYTFECGDVELKLSFTAPYLLDDLKTLARPVNYIS